MPIITWFLTNIRTIAVVAGLAVGGFMLYQLVTTIYNAGKLEVEVQHLRQDVANRNEAIAMLEKANELRDRLVEERNKQLEELEQRYQDLLSDLGPTENDQAPDSLKQLFRKLKAK